MIEACEQTLKDLQLDYLDLYLIHHPYAWAYNGLPIGETTWVKRQPDGAIDFGKGVSLEMTWQAMEKLIDMGQTRAIGVSNYSVALLCDLMQYARIPPAVNQCEAHVCNTRAQLRSVCNDLGVHFTMYSILGSGKVGPLGDAVVREIAEEKGAAPAQILIAWGMARGCSVLSKSTKKERIGKNFGAAKIELEEEELKRLDALDRGLITCNMEEYWQFPSHV